MPRLLLLLCVALLASCALKEKISPYKPDIQQGNVLSPGAVAKLKTGMTKTQVRFILGTPLVNDLFNPNRLYYIYRNQKGGGSIEQGNLTLYFEQDKLVRIDTDIVPQQSAAVAAIQSPVRSETAGKSTPMAVQPAANTKQESAALAGAPSPVAAQKPETIQPPLQAAANTKQESAALAGVPSPVAAQKPETIQPPLQAAANTKQESAALAGAPSPVAVQKPEPIQPPPQPAAKASVVSDEKLVMQAIHAWLRAWMKQDVEAYLASYAKEFKTPDNEPRSKWEQVRRIRVLRPKKIEIRLSSLKVQIADTENATAIFRQDYRSDSYGDKVIKELTFIKENGIWRIRQERVVKANGLRQDG